MRLFIRYNLVVSRRRSNSAPLSRNGRLNVAVVVVVRVVIVGIPGPLPVSGNRSSRYMDDPFGQRFGRLGVLHGAERSNPQVS